MIALDDGITWVDPREVESCEVGVYQLDVRRKERKAGISAFDRREHYVRTRTKSGGYANGNFLGVGADGLAKASRIIAELVAAVGP